MIESSFFYISFASAFDIKGNFIFLLFSQSCMDFASQFLLILVAWGV